MNGYNFSDASDIRLGSSTITALYYGSTLIWPKTTPPTPTDWSTEYLQVEALEPLTLTTDRSTNIYYSGDEILDIRYSTNKVDWYNWNKDVSLPLSTGDKVYFKGGYISGGQAEGNSSELFRTDGRCKVQGNIMSLVYADNFIGQTSLANHKYCFRNLFGYTPGYEPNFTDLSNLILPATTLAYCCYEFMFGNCSHLTIAPELPATTLADNCYERMFEQCTSLTTAPALPATTLATNCYNQMFYGCTALTNPPDLPATTLAGNCYYMMFERCSSLINAPELPATTLAGSCYERMFSNCTSLTTAPALPATVLVEDCYANMLTSCTSLKYIKCLATDMSATNCLYNWVANVAANGTFVKDAYTTWPHGASGIPSGWTVQDPSTEYLQVEALEPMTLTTAMPVSKTTNDILDVQYSTDKTNWNAWNADVSLSLSTGDKVYFKGSYLSTFTKVSNSAKYELCRPTGVGVMYNVQGNIMSLIYGDNFANQYSLQGYTYCFYKLFMGNQNITDMSNLILPATTLAAYCYSNMFNNCTSLTTAPVLPATELTGRCYLEMFKGCKSLTTAPALPATELGDYCYSNMFNGCKSLTTAPALPATTLKNNCYIQMFQYCTSLTTAPALPATKLMGRCYNQMFMGCTSLNYIKCLATDMTASNCLTDWVKNVAATGTFVKDAYTTWASGTSGIPADWTVQDM